MPTVNPVQSGDVRAAISRAAQSTGVDFDYLLAQARLESDLNPDARARTSSATGLYQFINSTWLDTLDRHGAKHGYGWAGDAIGAGGRVADGATRNQLLSLRYDADLSSMMAAELTRDNADGLRATLGREPDDAELYLAHFLGLGGARSILSANQSDPGRTAAAILPQAAQANRPVFFDGARARSVGEVVEVIRTRVAHAMGQGDLPGGPGYGPTGLRGDFYRAAARPQFTGSAPAALPSAALPSAPARRPSMAETLQATFANAGDGGGVGARAQDRINTAYTKFRAFGL